MVELQENDNKIHPLSLEILMTDAKIRDEDALRQGETDEPLEIFALNPTKLENNVKTGTRIVSKERRQLQQLLIEHNDVFA